MERVSVQLRIECPESTVQLQPPPDKDAPSARWMEKFAMVMKPLAVDINTFRCVLFGSLAEVSGHLWQHQILWMLLRPCEEGAGDRHVAVNLSELIDVSANLSSGRYSNTVPLEEESLDGKGEVTVCITLESIREGIGVPAAALQPSLPARFSLQLELSEGSSVTAKAMQEVTGIGRGPHLRCCGVEQPLKASMDNTLVLVDSWAEVPQALVELDVCIQVPMESSRDFVELPLDLSQLVVAASERGGGDTISARVKSEDVPSLGDGLGFVASVRSYHWASHGKLEPGRTRDAELWAEGLASDPRTWRVSVEVRSIRLTCCTANIFVMYSYEPLQQPRPFRTNPATLARRNTTVYLPHAFAAYSLAATCEQMRVRLEDPLRVEVWHRDIYRKDNLIGIAEVGLGAVFDRPLQHSSTMPSMVCGFRVLDQVCPVVGAAEAPQTSSTGQAGVIRLLLFLEDLGPTSAQAHPLHPLQPHEVHGGALAPAPSSSAADKVGDEAHIHNVVASPAIEAARPLVGANVPAHALPSASGSQATEVLKSVRESPGYSTAYELELWKRAEEEKFRAYLSEQETTMRERLEEEYRQRELSRAKEFRQKQSEFRELEAKVRRKLQELQQREVAVVTEEARVAALRDEVKRRTDLAIQEHEDACKRHATEAQHGLRLERDRSRHLEGRISELEAELATAKQRFKELEAEIDERRRQLEETPAARLQQDLQAMRLELQEARQHGETLAASRDHFRRKVEELCGRLLGAAEPQPTRDCPATPGRTPAINVQAQAISETAGLAQALQKIQENLGDLARNWGSGGGFASTPTSVVADPPSSMGELGRMHSLPGRYQVGSVADDVFNVVDRNHDGKISRSEFRDAIKGGIIVGEAGTTASSQHLQWLQGQREELLQSGLYSEGDPVLLAIDAKIIQASPHGDPSGG